MELSILKGLNSSQREGVLTTEGPLMIVAGAGSGKTRVLTHRIAHIIEKGGDPRSILVLTFTNKASVEMKERISQLVGEKSHDVLAGTFHAIFARLLRQHAHVLGYSPSFPIYDTQDTLQLIQRTIKTLELDKDLYKPRRIYAKISQCKNNLITPLDYLSDPQRMSEDRLANTPYFSEVYSKYVSQCYKQGAMDFDDLLLKMYELLSKSPEVLYEYQNRFRYILVDEYQDTNHLQYIIIRKLANRFRNICVVGDDSQSIYSFRGADISNIINFRRDYKDSQVVRLEQNYRSTQTIVSASNRLIENNTRRLEKKLFTENQVGEKIYLYKSIKDSEESKFVVADIQKYKEERRLKYQDFAILYRTNAQSRILEEVLTKSDVPYRLYGGLSFYQRKEVKDILAYLRLLINPKDDDAFLRVINYPTRGIGGVTLSRILVLAQKHDKGYLEVLYQLREISTEISPSVLKRLETFSYLIKSAIALMESGKSLPDVVEYIYRSSGMKKAIDEDMSEEGNGRKQNIEELFAAIQNFFKDSNQDYPLSTKDVLIGFLENAVLLTSVDHSDGSADSVSLMTVHLSKGLEFKCVYIVGMEDGLFPSLQPLSSADDLEEERRLCYVAMTRAKERLCISHNMERFKWGQLVSLNPSRFMNEIGDQYLEMIKKYAEREPKDSFQNTQRNISQKPKSSVSFSSGKYRPVSTVTSLDERNKVLYKNSEMAPGSLVSHEKFGRGSVIKILGQGKDVRAMIDFENGGRKNLLLQFARLKIL